MSLSPQAQLRVVATAWPWRVLPASATVDVVTFVAVPRPAMRTVLTTHGGDVDFDWTAGLPGWCSASRDGFLVIARSPEALHVVMSLDESPYPHCQELGRALGYPECCSLAADREGEANLDSFEASMTPALGGGLLDLQGYRAGRAWVSHIPCSPSCYASLGQARRAREVMRSLGPPEAWPSTLARWRAPATELDVGSRAGARKSAEQSQRPGGRVARLAP